MDDFLNRIASDAMFRAEFDRYLFNIRSKYSNSIGKYLELYKDLGGSYEGVVDLCSADYDTVKFTIDWYLSRICLLIDGGTLTSDFNVYDLDIHVTRKLINAYLYTRQDVIDYCQYYNLSDIKGIGLHITNEILYKLRIKKDLVYIGLDDESDEGYIIYNNTMKKYYSASGFWVNSIYKSKIYATYENAEIRMKKLKAYNINKEHEMIVKRIEMKEID